MCKMSWMVTSTCSSRRNYAGRKRRRATARICRGIREGVALLETEDYDSAFRRRFPGRCKPSAIRCRGAESGAGRREIGRECVRVRGEACDQSRLDDEQAADLIGLIWSD